MTAQNIGFLSRILEEWRCIFDQLPDLEDAKSFHDGRIHPQEDYVLVTWEVRSNSLCLTSHATVQELEEDLLNQVSFNHYRAAWLPVLAYRLSTESEFEITPRGFELYEQAARRTEDGFRATFTEQQLERQAPV